MNLYNKKKNKYMNNNFRIEIRLENFIAILAITFLLVVLLISM